MAQQPATATHRGGGLCLLSLDAGGSRAISQLRILVKLMEKSISSASSGSIDRPCGIFDMIGGTGSAGFVAILLVILGLTAQQALDEYIDLSSNVLQKRGLDPGARTTGLRGHIDILLRGHGFKPTARLMDPNGRSANCKLVVPISYYHSVGSTCTLRNFEVRQERALNLTIAQALLVTLATPPRFTPISISKDAATFEYISGDLALSNPTRELISEAHGAFGPEQRVACLMSLGCGHPGIISTPKDADSASWNRFLEKLVLHSEQTAQSVDSQMGHLGIYFRLSANVGFEKPTMDPAPAEIIAHTDVYLEDFLVSQKIERCLDFLKIRDGIPSLEQLKYSGGERTLPPTLPPLTRNFVMRPKPWQFVQKTLLIGEDRGTLRMLVVTGMGGSGKTQLVLKFMHIHKERFSSMFFIDSSSKGRLRGDIVRHVRSLGPEHSQKTFEDCLLFLAQPTPNGRRLIVYDNVDDPSLDLAPLLPQGSSCMIIITSRDRLIGGLNPGGHLELEAMSMDEAVELVIHNSRNYTSITEQDRENARNVAEALGCLPLALQQACSYMFQTKCSAQTYLELLSTSRGKLLSMALNYQLDNRSISTYAAFDASFDRLAFRTQQFLRLIAFFHWSNFPLELIFLGARHHFSEYEAKYIEHGDSFQTGKSLLEEIFLHNGVWDPTILDEMTKSIQNYSLITLVPGVDTILLQIHPLAHGWIRSCIPNDDEDKYQSAAILLLALGARRQNTPSAKYLSSHATYMSAVWDGLHANDAEAFARILTEGGLFSDALGLRELVVVELRNQLDTQSLLFSDALWLLAVAYSNVGRFAEAQVLQVQVLSLRKGVVQENDPSTLDTSISLANTYRILRQFEDAEALQVEVLRIRRETLGNNTDTLVALNNLALTYSDSGRLEKAETLQVEALALSKELRGEHHPDTLIASGDLAQIYLKLRRPKEALPLQLEVVRLSKEVRGDRHPETSKAMSQLSLIYSALGEFPDAETLQEEVRRLSKEQRGERHPVTITASSSLAKLYLELGRFNEALSLQNEVLRLRKELLGERHLDTIDAGGDLAQIYLGLGRAVEAEWLQEEMWRRKKELLGEAHPDAIEAAKKLAKLLFTAHRFAVTRPIYQRVTELTKQTYGENHIEYLSARADWTCLWEMPGEEDWRGWLALMKWRTKHLGESHPDAVYALAVVAVTYRWRGRLSKAKRMQQKVVQLRKDTSGHRHPDTMRAYYQLAFTYHSMGKFAQAESLLLQVLGVLKETGRGRHPDGIRASLCLAHVYYGLGRFEEAVKLEEEGLTVYKEVLGKDQEAVIKHRVQSGTLGMLRKALWLGTSWAERVLD